MLRQLRGHRMRPGDSPHREDMLSPPGEWVIGEGYELADFRRSEHQDERKRRMVGFYEDALERGVRFTAP